jgi:hypothetical protein
VTREADPVPVWVGTFRHECQRHRSRKVPLGERRRQTLLAKNETGHLVEHKEERDALSKWVTTCGGTTGR